MGELLKGLSDLPVSLLALLFAYSLRLRGQLRWAAVFLLVGIAALLGALLHGVPLAPDVLRAVWCLEYALMFTAVFCFCRQMGLVVSGTRPGPAVYALSVALFAAAIVLRLRDSRWDIYMLVAYAAVLGIPLAFRILTRPGSPACARWMLAAAGLSLAFQALKTVIPFGVVLGHLCLLAALALAFRTAVQEPGAD